MGGHKIINQNELHYVTFTIVGWVDVFSREIYIQVIIESLQYCVKKKGLRLFAYVIMSNHIHLIIKTNEPNNLSDIIRDFKTFTSKTIIKLIQKDKKESRKTWMLNLFEYHAKLNSRNAKYQFWQQDNHPVELDSPKWISQKLVYIHLNPVRAGIVNNIEHYKYSSAENYEGLGGLIDIELLDDDLVM